MMRSATVAAPASKRRTVLEVLCFGIYGSLQSAAPYIGLAPSTLYLAVSGNPPGDHAQRKIEEHFEIRLDVLLSEMKPEWVEAFAEVIEDRRKRSGRRYNSHHAA